MNVLILCEFSGVVRDAFVKLGHSALSVDLLPSETPGWHYQGDALHALQAAERAMGDGWTPTLLIAHPPCTYLAVSGARWFKDRIPQQEAALAFVQRIMGSTIRHICVENPISVISTRICKPDQIIQPWMFGHGETKATCLWLKNLPKLRPTNIVEGREGRVHKEPPSPERWKNRSRTYQGIANAMAEQWGSLDNTCI